MGQREKRFGLVRLTDLEGSPVFIEAENVSVIGPRRTQFGTASDGALVVLEGGISVFVSESVRDVVERTTTFFANEEGETGEEDFAVDASAAVIEAESNVIVGAFDDDATSH